MLGRAALWGPAAVCAGGRRPARSPLALHVVAVWHRWCSGRRRARPPARSPHASCARSGRSRSPPVPSGPSGALHTGDDWRAGVWLSASSRSPPVPSGPSGALHTGGTCGAWTSPARPCCQSHFTPSRRTLIVESAINFACNSLIVLSNHEFRLLELQRFQTLLKLLPIELHATFLRPGSAVTFRLRGQALRLEVCSVPPVSATVGVLPGVT